MIHSGKLIARFNFNTTEMERVKSILRTLGMQHDWLKLKSEKPGELTWIMRLEKVI